MDPKTMSVLIAIAVVVAGLAVWLFVEQRRRRGLRQRFGPEYQRTVEETGSVRRADTILEGRTKRVERLNIRPLSADDAARFGEAWRDVQKRFVDAPDAAVADADRLVGEVMHARGYPLGDFDQRAADISVDHPRVVANYRAARDIARRHERGEASTEDLRQAFVHYRSLFEDLLEIKVSEHATRIGREDWELARGRR